MKERLPMNMLKQEESSSYHGVSFKILQRLASLSGGFQAFLFFPCVFLFLAECK